MGWEATAEAEQEATAALAEATSGSSNRVRAPFALVRGDAERVKAALWTRTLVGARPALTPGFFASAVPAQGYGYPQQPPLPQQQMPYGAGYPQQPMHGGYMQGGYPQQPMVMQQQPMYQQSRGRMGGGGMGGMGAGVLGAGAGLLGGMMIMDAM